MYNLGSIVLLVIFLGVTLLTSCDRATDKRVIATNAVDNIANQTTITAKNDQEAQANVFAQHGQMYQLAPGQKVGAVFAKITNNSSQPFTVKNITTNIAGFVEIHKTDYADGMMQMRPIDEFTIKVGQVKIFAPKGYHFMLFDIVNQPTLGETFVLTLESSDGRMLEIDVVVKPIA